MTSPTASSSSPSTPTTSTTTAVGQEPQQAAGGELKNEVSPSSSSVSTTTPKSFTSQGEINMEACSSSPVSDTHDDSVKKNREGGDSHDKQVEGAGAGKPVESKNEEEKSKESTDQASSSSDDNSNNRKAPHEIHKRKRDGEGEDRERRDFKGGKKPRKNMGETDFPKRREDMTPEQLKARIKRQIEYYFSDESLSYDAFFQGVMKEAAQQGKGESLEMRYILSCPRIKSLDISKEEILEAIQDSSLVQVKEEDGATYLYRSSPLPELRERSQNNPSSYNRRPGGRDGDKGGHFKNSHQGGGLGKNPHAAGCFLKIFDIPESITQWQAVKDSLKDALPKEALVRYVSRIDTVTEAEGKKTRRCWVYLGSFEKDREVLEGMQPIKVPIGGDDGQEHAAQAAVLTDQEIRLCVQDMPPRVRTNREKDLQTLRRQLCALPLTIGGVNFTSVDHLRSCINEFLQKTPVNQTLKPGSAAERAVKGLLEYHPKAFVKKGGRDKEVSGIKVGLHEKTNSQTGERMKCFFVVRKKKNATEESEEQDEEDFSVQKCIAELAKDPPCEEKALQELLKQRYEQSAQQREHQAAEAERRRKIRENANKAMKPHSQTEEEKENPSPSSQPSSTGDGKADADQKKTEKDGDKAEDRKEEKPAEESEEKKTSDAPETGSEATKEKTDGDVQNKEGTEG